MGEHLQFLILNPATWVAAAILVGLCVAALSLRFRFGRRAAGIALGAAWIALTLVGQLLDLDHFWDGRYWVHTIVTVAASIAPVALFVITIPKSKSSRWIIGGGLVSVFVGALLFPYVALLSVCALGIDCL